MERFILFFDTKLDGPSRFPRAELTHHKPPGGGKCYVAVVEELTLKRAWYEVFRVFPDYKERGSGDWSRIPHRKDYNGRLIERTFEDVQNYYVRKR